MKALLMINGGAGTGKLSRDCYRIVEHLARAGYRTTVFPIIPEIGLTAETILKDQDGRYDLVVCGGGDGTLNHTLDGIMHLDPRPVIGYVPAGSTNDFAKGMGITGGIERICRILVQGQPFAYDVGQFNDRYFNYVAAFGAFVAISYATEQKYKNMLGHAAYVLNGISKLQENISSSTHMRVETDYGVEEGDFLFGAVYSTTSIGGVQLKGKMRSHLHDGKLELLLIRTPKLFGDIELIAANLLAGRTDNPNIIFRQITHARFVSDTGVNWTLDGEYGGSVREANIQVEHEAVQILVPRT